jgi:predicted nucleotidyltransferase
MKLFMTDEERYTTGITAFRQGSIGVESVGSRDNISGLTRRAILGELNSRSLYDRYNVSSVHAIGSVGRGNPRSPDSDIDILIIVNQLEPVRTDSGFEREQWSSIALSAEVEMLVMDHAFFIGAPVAAPYRRFLKYGSRLIWGQDEAAYLPSYDLDAGWYLNLLRIRFGGSSVDTALFVGARNRRWLDLRGPMKTLMKAAGEMAASSTGILYTDPVACAQHASRAFPDLAVHLHQLAKTYQSQASDLSGLRYATDILVWARDKQVPLSWSG